MREFLKYVRLEEMPSRNAICAAVVNGDEHVALISLIGVVQGEILEYLERKKFSTMRNLLKCLPHPTHVVTMALGALIYSGLVKAKQDEKYITVWLDSWKPV